MPRGEMFDMNDRDLKKLMKLYKRAPRQMRRVNAGILNTFAFGVRTDIPQSIDELMTVRNPRFVKSKTRVEMAKATQPIEQQQSRVGSIRGPRFSGWTEQQTGKRTTRSRVATMNARGGNFKKPMQGKSRLKPNQKFDDPDNIKGAKDDNHRLFIFLKMHERRKKQQSFMIRRKIGKFKPGLYRFKGKNVRKQQDLRPLPDRKQPAKKPWMTHAVNGYFRRVSIGRIWRKEIKHVFKLK